MNLPLLISALSFLISFFSFFYFRSYLKRRTSQERILAEMQEEVNVILKSINETTDRDISLILDREKRLKTLLGEIEKRLALYVREMGQFDSAEERYAKMQTETSIARSETSINRNETSLNRSYSELGKNRYRMGSEGNSQTAELEEAPVLEPAFPLPDFEVKTAGLPKAPSTPKAPSIAEQIHSLLRSGFSASMVASRLGVSIAEVELAAALFERRDS